MVGQMSRRLSLVARWRLAGFLAAIVVVACADAVQAVDDVVVEQTDRAEEDSDAQQNMIDLEAQFDQTVFGEQPGWEAGGEDEPDQRGGDRARDILAGADRLAARRLAAIERICGLRPAQVRALRLAMESDIRRMADAVGRERAKYVGGRVNLNDQAGQRRFNVMQQEAARSHTRVRNLFETGSLFRKSLVAVLDESQAGRLAASRDQQRALVWKSLVLTVMLEVDERLGLDQSQADALERILLEKVPPLRVESPVTEMDQQHNQEMLVYAMLAEADQKRLKAAVSARQWRMLSQYVSQGRGQRENLEQQGLIEKTDKAVKPVR